MFVHFHTLTTKTTFKGFKWSYSEFLLTTKSQALIAK